MTADANADNAPPLAWSMCRVSDGRLTGDVYSGPAVDLEANVPPGCVALPGALPRDAFRGVQGDDGWHAIEERAPAPADTELESWTFDEAVGRYVAKPTLAAAKRRRIAELQAAIDAHEVQQARPQRDVLTALVSGLAPPPEAVLRLQEIEAAIVPLRARRAALEAASTTDEVDAIERQA